MWLSASEEACGVRNGYAHPSQLGADRWAALVAARTRASAELFPAPCVVVNVRTAISIDALDASGVFRGGIVVPGLNLMMQSLAANTSLKMPPGRYDDFPVSNADALASGAVQAVCGAIEQMRARLAVDGVAVRCLLSGGAASELAPHLTGPVEVVDNLVLEGALVLAEAGYEAQIAMRTLFFLLLLANLTLFGFIKLDSMSGGEAVRLAQQVQPDKIKLLTPQQVAALGPAKVACARRRVRGMGPVFRC